jgi:hypothetical protein
VTAGVFVGAIVGIGVGMARCCVLCVTTTGGVTIFSGIALTAAVDVGIGEAVAIGEGISVGLGVGVGVMVGVGVGVGVLVGVGVGVGVLVGVGVGVLVEVDVGVSVIVELGVGEGVVEDRLELVVEWLLAASALVIITKLPAIDKNSTESGSPPMINLTSLVRLYFLIP